MVSWGYGSCCHCAVVSCELYEKGRTITVASIVWRVSPPLQKILFFFLSGGFSRPTCCDVDAGSDCHASLMFRTPMGMS